MTSIAELAEDRDGRRRLRRRAQGAAAHAQRRLVSRARAGRSERPHRGARLERRRAAGSPLRRGRRGEGARTCRAVRRSACSCRCGRSRRRPTPTRRRSRPRCAATQTSSTAFSSSLPGRSPTRALRRSCGTFLDDASLRAALRALPAAGAEGHHGYAGGLLEHTVGVATLCRETAQLHPRLRHDLLLAAALLHDVGRTRRAGARARRSARPRRGGCSDMSTSGSRLIEERAGGLDRRRARSSSMRSRAHHDRKAARTAEAAVLYHANQLDAQAATRPVGDD